MKSVGNGIGLSQSKYVNASSSQTTGANGRNFSRCFTLVLSNSLACGLHGLAKILRAPSARGPHSILSWNQPTTLLLFSNCAVWAIISLSSLNCVYLIVFLSKNDFISDELYAGPKYALLM